MLARRRVLVLDKPAYPRDRAERQRRADQDEERFLDPELDDGRRLVCPKEQEERFRSWQAMELFIKTHKKGWDFHQIWLRLCRDDPRAKVVIRSYFCHYVRRSQVNRPALGEEEYETVQMINCTKTVIDHWKNLVAEADNTVLREMRRKDPDNYGLWKLRWDLGEPKDRPVADISNWIRKEMKEEFDLIPESKLSIKKHETTADDLLMLLDTLWTRAEHVPCLPLVRVSVHWTLVLAGFGFRPGSLMDFRFKHVRLWVLRDEETRRTALAAAITVTHEKRFRADPRAQGPGITNATVEFTVFMVPCQLLCLVTLIATQAIAARAFKTPFESLDEMLDRPNLEHTDALELHWKDDMLDREMFPMNYHTFWSMWHQLWMVSGNRGSERPYSLRVGAGSRLDGPLTPALRSHFMANSEKIFQQRYLPVHIRKEMMPILFGPEAAGVNERLFAMVRRATMNRDEHAPLYATIDDMEDLEKRRDMQELKKEYDEARDSKGWEHRDTRRAHAAYAKRRSVLRALLVLRDREKYFDEADGRRALGQSTSDLSTPTAKLSIPSTRTVTADRVAMHLGRFLRERDLGGQRRARVFSQLLFAYLQNRGTEVAAIMHSLEGTKDPRDAAEQEGGGWTCLLCSASYASRGGLTRHNEKFYFMKGTFDRPFPCPECDRLGNEKHMVEGVEQWSNHVERHHGITHTPCLPSRGCQRKAGPGEPKPAKSRDARCPLCAGMFYPGKGFSRHTNKEHRDQAPFVCLECSGQDGSKAVTTENWAAWMDHVAKVHGRDGQTWNELSGQTVLGKRKRGRSKDRGPGAEKHLRLD